MPETRRFPPLPLVVLGAMLLAGVAARGCIPTPAARADGKLMPPREYAGSLEEKAQEAIIIFHGSDEPGRALEDLILKITVAGGPKAGDGASFGWVVPLPGPPEVAREDPELFKECFDYVEARLALRRKRGKERAAAGLDAAERRGVHVISRKIVGTYEVAVVREQTPGALNRWLEKEGFQTLPEGEEVIAFYRRKGYVFACLKVNDAARKANTPVDLHPLRFTFRTGGRDGIYFPMKMTGLQNEPFDVNLYVFYRAWLNARRNRYGHVHRGFRLRFRDRDSPKCKPNAGKAWSSPEDDPYLAPLAQRIPTLARLFQRLHPGERYYLTAIQAWRLKPREVRRWSDDLWLFPCYVDPDFVPFDARPGGPGAGAWAKD